jgi:hypothetical protein
VKGLVWDEFDTLKKKVNEEWNKLPKVFNEEDNDF